jgi:penicillin-binding protein 1B
MPKRQKTKRRFFKNLFILSLAGLMILSLYLIHLDRVIVHRFEARRWNLPSRVYSDAFPLYNGRTVTLYDLKERLAYLGYRATNTTPTHFGEFLQVGGHFEIYLHSFAYPHEEFAGALISFDINGDKVFDLKKLESGETISLINIEPELIASIFDEKMEDRTFVKLPEIPRLLTDTTILIEDERFYKHHGIDPIGILRAFAVDVLHRGFEQGASTITQQMVRNFFLTLDKKVTRKVNEMLMSTVLEMRYSKEEILEVYLNEIYFGERDGVSVTGIQEAARYYFSKDVSQITPDEIALLVAVIKSPGLYSPFLKPDNCLERRNLVLKKMVEANLISHEDHLVAAQRPLPQRPKRDWITHAPYFIDFVKKQLKETFSSDILESEGLRIFTTLDMNQQRAAEKSINDNLDRLEKERGTLKKNAEAGKHIEGALIALQPKTGFVRAYVGGRDFKTNQFDIVSQAKRQPGSTFKPFAYLAALDPTRSTGSWTLSGILQDEPLALSTAPGKWTPQNYDKTFHGPVRLRTALENSYNVATVWLAEQVGFENVVDVAHQAGVESKLEPYPSIVLGSFEVTPLEMAEAYSTFANNGTRSKPVSVRRVVTTDGQVLEKKSISLEQVFEQNVIFILNMGLRGVMDQGTGASARSLGFTKIAAGKTGTTSDYKDSWFVGYTPDLLALTWVGYKENETTGLSGANGALPVWAQFMRSATETEPNKDFEATADIILVKIDPVTGLLYDPDCGPSPVDDFFIEGTEPKEFCNHH